MKEQYLKACNNILHIGGHRGQEAAFYEELGLDFTFVEPNPTFASILRDKGYKTIEAAVSDQSGLRTLYLHPVSSELSSLKLESGTAPRAKIEVETKTLSDIQDGFDGLSIDAQGETYEILSSGQLDQFKVIICETSKQPRYDKERSSDEVGELLKASGFTLQDTYRHETKDVYDEVWICEQ